ncbi:MAG: hypothetical protein ACK4E0_17980 [Chitinophagaceae bacterium]
MTSTPHITIYPEGNFDYSPFGDSMVRATLIFSKHLGYNKSLARKRVNIHLGNEDRIHTDGSIKSIWVKSNIETATQNSDLTRIEVFLKIIHTSLVTIGKMEGWDTSSFEKAYSLSLADKGNFVWYSKPVANKSRTLKARIRISLDKDGKVPIVAEFFDSKLNYQFEILIIDTFLHFVDGQNVFEKPVWLDDENFGFKFLNSQLLVFANAIARGSNIHVTEKDWNRVQIEGRLRQLTYRRFSNDKEFAECANK